MRESQAMHTLGRQGGKGNHRPFWLKPVIFFPQPARREREIATGCEPYLLTVSATSILMRGLADAEVHVAV